MNTHNHTAHFPYVGMLEDFIGISLFIMAIAVYLLCVVISNRRYKPWPIYRVILWIFGVLAAAVALVGPLANQAHHDFTAHMGVHLLLGMLAPLLMALAAPMTLLLRTFNVAVARRLSKILRSSMVRFLTDPFVASVLNVGGLWVLYTTSLYKEMHENVLLHLFIHLHIFLAGYVFTLSVIYIDLTSHRNGFLYRAVVLILATAAHSILAKYIYAHPPIGVIPTQAEEGAMLMYYGGDAVTLIIIYVLCHQWYRGTRPRFSISTTR